MMDSASTDRTKFLRGLRAVREFTTEPVSDEVVNDILEVGRWTSTGGNRQGTEVVVIRDPTVKQKLGDWGAKPAANAAVVFLLVTEGDAGVLDEGRMAERLALAARAHGLGSIVNTLKNDGPAEVKKLLGIPEDRRTILPWCRSATSTAKLAERCPRTRMAAESHWSNTLTRNGSRSGT